MASIPPPCPPLPPPPAPRIREPVRDGQIVWRVTEDSLPISHPGRLFWEVVGTLDLSAFFKSSKAVEGRAGRPTHSVRMLLTLWLYALSQGVSEARKITRLTKSDFAYRWIAGDMEVCHDRLSRLRSEHRLALNNLYTQVLGVLLCHGLISLDLVGQDGTRVRASAGAASFRSERGLKACEEQARLHLHAVLGQQDDEELTDAQKARRLSAAEEYLHRVEEAKQHLASMPPLPPTGDAPGSSGEATGTSAPSRPAGVPTALSEPNVPSAGSPGSPGSPRRQRPARGKRSQRSPRKARVSTTDPEARVMKMPDGGYRPAFNIQFATAGSALGGPRTVVGLLVSNIGSDMGSLIPLVEDIEARTGQVPGVLLADGNHAKYSDIETLRARGIRVLVPPMGVEKDKAGIDKESPELQAWRKDMESEEGKKRYRARAGLSELSNAHVKGKEGMDQFVVRGMGKVMGATLLAVLSLTLLNHASALLN